MKAADYLDNIAELYDMERLENEDNDSFRKRIFAKHMGWNNQVLENFKRQMVTSHEEYQKQMLGTFRQHIMGIDFSTEKERTIMGYRDDKGHFQILSTEPGEKK